MINFQQLSDSDRERLARQAIAGIGFRSEHLDKSYPKQFDNYKGQNFNAIMRQIAQAAPVQRPNSILLVGVVGAGKSSLLAAFAKTYFEAFGFKRPSTKPKFLPACFQDQAAYCTHTELSKLWEHEFDDDQSFVNPEYFTHVPALFLDDIGTAPVNQSGRNIAKLEELLDYRWGSHLKTFAASNVTLADLLKPPLRNDWIRIVRRLSEKEWMFYHLMPEPYHIANKQKGEKSEIKTAS